LKTGETADQALEKVIASARPFCFAPQRHGG
jgi:hypothetical protein